MAAAMISFVLGVSLFSVGFLAEALPVATQWQSQVLSYFGLFEQMHNFGPRHGGHTRGDFFTSA